MARPLRIQYPGAIYHVMARGNGRQLLFHEGRDYRRMLDGLEKTVERTGWEGWLLGSEAFLKKIKKTFSEPAQPDQVPAARRLSSLEADDVIEAVAAHYGVPAGSYRQRRSTAPGRDLAAHLAHRRTTATLRQLAEPFGLRHPDSVSNLIRRTEKALAASPKLRKTVIAIDNSLAKTENRV